MNINFIIDIVFFLLCIAYFIFMSIGKKRGSNGIWYYDMASYVIITPLMIISIYMLYLLRIQKFLWWFFVRVGLGGLIGNFIGERVPIK